MGIFPMSVANNFCDMPLPKYIDSKTVLIYRPHPVSFLKGNEENPALLLSNVHNRTSARDGPVFGAKGPSMNTSSLYTTNLFLLGA